MHFFNNSSFSPPLQANSTRLHKGQWRHRHPPPGHRDGATSLSAGQSASAPAHAKPYAMWVPPLPPPRGVWEIY